MPKVSELFNLDYGHSLELNRLEQSSRPDSVNFVSRTTQNNGVSARVNLIPGLPAGTAGTITVALNGQGGAGVAFLQPFPYYCGFHVMILTPKKEMTEKEKLWWVMCITANRFRFGFGRQANRTLKDLDLPEPSNIPGWVHSVSLSKTLASTLGAIKQQSETAPKNAPCIIGLGRVKISELFDVQLGTNLELLRLTKKKDGVNFVSRTAKNNGVSARVAPIPTLDPTPGGVLSVAGGGSVLETFVQFEPFYSGRDLFFLRPKESMTAEELMFYAACIKANQSRYSYGRQANRTLKELLIPARNEIPTWVYGSFARVATQIELAASSI